MESNWRFDVWDLIGPRRFDASSGGLGVFFARLVAELNPHLSVGGKVWSHLVGGIDGANNHQIYLGRRSSLNVLDEFRNTFWGGVSFPGPYTVLPDST